MPKTIISPVKRFSGTVVLPDALTFPQYKAFDDCYKAIKIARDEQMDKQAQNQLALPGILACVAEWHLDHITPEQLTLETFPATPYVSVSNLLGWLFQEISDLIFEADDSPNA